MPSVNNKSVFAIVLAAGAATRFGGVKQLAAFRGVPLARHACALAVHSCDERSLLVVGHEWRAVADACAPLPGFIVLNEQYDSGMASSLALGVRAVRHVADAIIVLLADQPLISNDHIANLLGAWSGDEREIVATRYAGIRGSPTLFGSACFDRLATLTGDQGARVLFDDPQFAVQDVAFEAAAMDVDTAADLVSLEHNARN